jgi:hypothetical protein
MTSVLNVLRNERLCYGWLAVAFAVISFGFFVAGGVGYGRMALGVGFGISALLTSFLWLDQFEQELNAGR